MVEIARETNNQGIFQKDIAFRQNLSNKYLDQIIVALKAAGLIINVRGKKSGYMLTRDADKITILDIHKAFEPGIQMIDCLAPGYFCEKEKYCSAKNFWQGLNNLVADYFSSFTLADILIQQIDLELMAGITVCGAEKNLIN
jgi:Rrf2 family protein